MRLVGGAEKVLGTSTSAGRMAIVATHSHLRQWGGVYQDLPPLDELWSSVSASYEEDAGWGGGGDCTCVPAGDVQGLHPAVQLCGAPH